MSVYWGLAIFAMAFWIRNEPGDSRYYKGVMFLIFSLGSLVLYRPNRMNRGMEYGILAGMFWIFMSHWQHPGMVWKTLHFTTGMVLFYHLYSCRDNFNKKLLKDLLALACIGQAIWIFLNWAGYDPGLWLGMRRKLSTGEFTQGEMILAGSLDNVMVSATFLALTFPFLLRKNWIWWAIPTVGATILTKSATGLAGIGVGSFSYLFYKKKYQELILLVVLSSALSVTYLPDSFWKSHARLVAWAQSMEIYLNSNWINQVFGWGPGIYKYHVKGMLNLKKPFIHPHNEFISILFQFGLAGLGVFLWGVWKALKGQDLHFKSCLCVLLLCMVTSFPLHIASTATISILIFVFLLDFRSDRMLI